MEAGSLKAMKKAAGVDDSLVLTEPLVPQIYLNINFHILIKKGLKNRPLCVWRMPEDTAVF